MVYELDVLLLLTFVGSVCCLNLVFLGLVQVTLSICSLFPAEYPPHFVQYVSPL